jgi:hypothetical protein
MKERIQRFVWDLNRFGLTPGKMVARVINRVEPRVVVISVPKAGTHLVERLLCLHPRMYRPLVSTLHSHNVERYGGLSSILNRLRPGGILITHLHYSEEVNNLLINSGVKVIVVIRDPRDIVVSRAFYVARNPAHHYYKYAVNLSLKERLYRAIVGDPEHGYLSIRQTLEWFAGWLETEYFLIRYEQVLDDSHRSHVVRDLFVYLGIPLSDKYVAHISQRAISNTSPTFRKGSSGEWRQHFDQELFELFLRTCGDLMERYGYG